MHGVLRERHLPYLALAAPGSCWPRPRTVPGFAVVRPVARLAQLATKPLSDADGDGVANELPAGAIRAAGIGRSGPPNREALQLFGVADGRHQ